MTKDEALGLIEKEYATAREAERVKNDGMVRVCARRAAGIAIRSWLARNPAAGYPGDTMNALRSVQTDDTLPADVRDAAVRLTTKTTEQFTSPFSTHPLEDANIIIHHFMQDT